MPHTQFFIDGKRNLKLHYIKHEFAVDTKSDAFLKLIDKYQLTKENFEKYNEDLKNKQEEKDEVNE